MSRYYVFDYEDEMLDTLELTDKELELYEESHPDCYLVNADEYDEEYITIDDEVEEVDIWNDEYEDEFESED